jgi:pyruvate/2-oxoglutarate dehydrogenase complex dihydrolipoamide dehydrogenase (E3) component
VIATSSWPAVPWGKAGGGGDLTNETIFDLGELPGWLAVLGGGAVGHTVAVKHRHA